MKEQENTAFEPMPEEPQPAAAENGDADALSTARRNMLYGLLWCVAGLAFSFISYYFTEAGSRYVVATGAIVWGAVQAIGGLIAYVRELRARGEGAAAVRAVALGCCTAVVIAGLGYASWRIVRAAEATFVDTEQSHECPELGLRLTVPAGFSEIETEDIGETDSSYPYHRVSAWSEGRSIMVEGTVGSLADEGAEEVDAIAASLAEQAAEFLDGGLAGEGCFVEMGGIRMLRHTGRRSEFPEWNVALYDLVRDGSLVSIYYYTRSDEVADEADAFVADAVEFFDTPARTAE